MTLVPRRDENGASSTPWSDALARKVADARVTAPAISDMADAEWMESVAKQLEDIIALDEGWDGYRVGRIRIDVIVYAVRVLERIMRSKSPAPRITPMSNEGIMLEWHENGLDLELEIERPGRVWFWFEDSLEGFEDEKPLTSDLRALTLPIDKLTKRALLK